MPKNKAGLHKGISSIFDGVPIPKNKGVSQPPHAPAPDFSHYTSPKPPAAPATSTAPPPKAEQPTQPPPKAAPSKKSKADTIIKTTSSKPAWKKTWQQIESRLFAPKEGVSTARQKTMAILIPVLFIVLIFVFIRVFSVPSPKTTGAGQIGPTNARSVAGSGNEIDWQIPATYPATLRDPMQFGSVTTAQAGTGRLIVKGIVYSEDNPSAVIGNQILRVGDRISGATVVKINKDSVEFEIDGKRWTQKVQ